MTNKIEELGKVLIEIDGLEERIAELEKIKTSLKVILTMEYREQQTIKQEDDSETIV